MNKAKHGEEWLNLSFIPISYLYCAHTCHHADAQSIKFGAYSEVVRSYNVGLLVVKRPRHLS